MDFDAFWTPFGLHFSIFFEKTENLDFWWPYNTLEGFCPSKSFHFSVKIPLIFHVFFWNPLQTAFLGAWSADLASLGRFRYNFRFSGGAGQILPADSMPIPAVARAAFPHQFPWGAAVTPRVCNDFWSLLDFALILATGSELELSHIPIHTPWIL